MNSLCRVCKNREYIRFELDGVGYVGGKHWCKVHKKPITEVKVCKEYDVNYSRIFSS